MMPPWREWHRLIRPSPLPLSPRAGRGVLRFFATLLRNDSAECYSFGLANGRIERNERDL